MGYNFFILIMPMRITINLIAFDRKQRIIEFIDDDNMAILEFECAFRSAVKHQTAGILQMTTLRPPEVNSYFQYLNPFIHFSYIT